MFSSPNIWTASSWNKTPQLMFKLYSPLPVITFPEFMPCFDSPIWKHGFWIRFSEHGRHTQLLRRAPQWNIHVILSVERISLNEVLLVFYIVAVYVAQKLKSDKTVEDLNLFVALHNHSQIENIYLAKTESWWIFIAITKHLLVVSD